MDGFNILLGFLEGFALIISPCILPILPIMLAGSITGSKKRPLGITAGFVVVFTLLAFFSRQLVHYAGVDLNIIRYVAYALLLLLGAVLLSNWLTERFDRMTQRLKGENAYFTAINNPQSGFLNGFLFGSVVAIIWTPCAGPILAAVIVQTVIQQSTVLSFLTLLAFTFGAALPMLLIAMYGKKLIKRFNYLKTKGIFFRKLLGAILIASVSWMIIQERVGITAINISSGMKTATRLQDGLWSPYPAPVIAGIDTWINSPPLQLSALKGHVVLIDFWTYSCINCIRTLPYINYFDKQYRNKGLVIIGIHTPEFDFEKNPGNVKQAVKRNGIQYPVALDNQFVTWRNFKNQYWPAHYLIDKQGRVVYEHFGEGNNEVTENNIRYLLGIDSPASTNISNNPSQSSAETPETYLGYARADSAFSPKLTHDNPSHYSYSQLLSVNAWGLQGNWQVMPDKIVARQANAALKIHFHARYVYVVMGNGKQTSIQVNLFLNGRKQAPVRVDKESLYAVIALPHVEDGILELIPDTSGLEVYTFTFGSAATRIDLPKPNETDATLKM